MSTPATKVLGIYAISQKDGVAIGTSTVREDRSGVHWTRIEALKGRMVVSKTLEGLTAQVRHLLGDAFTVTYTPSTSERL